MAERDQEGTLDPTERRRQEARLDGQVVASPDLAAAASILAGCLFLMWFGGSLGDHLRLSFRVWLQDVSVGDWTQLHSRLGAEWLSRELLSSCGAFVAVLMTVGLLIWFLQVRFVISFRPMELDLEKLSPTRGWQRLFSTESAVRGVLGISKVLLLLTVASSILWFRREELSAGNFSSVGGLFAYAWNLGLTICLSLALTAFVPAVIDYVSRWLQNEQKLKMTFEEMKREQKDETGDPTIKAAVRRRQREAMKNQSVADVPEATVVLTNPTHFAVALKYESGKMASPKVVAKGAGPFAANIISIARSHRIPVIRRPPLTRALFRSVSVGQEIPSVFFRAVAEILGEVYRMRHSQRRAA
ncbi:MAG: EscU/YscU/HrcU family type III secretion system export apparatus switch protein [Planctomycetaceae bacterium]|nr:EscU/YscU/HrcU family type III secretion system export apparatus switch protein [Planctomycetaceae bacterium]